jgi:RNA polymerase sigma-70 factor (ECF subfamily)
MNVTQLSAEHEPMDTIRPTTPMPDRWPIFERSRERLTRVARRILGSSDDAEDVVQEAALRWLKADPVTVRAPEGWLVAVVSRLAIDRLRRSRTERHVYLEVRRDADEREAEWAQHDAEPETGPRLARAFVLLRERLEPVERAAFALRELFDCGYAEIAQVLAKSEAACRQIVHRARDHLLRGETTRPVRRGDSPQLMRGFIDALRAEDRERALSILIQPRADKAPPYRVSAARSARANAGVPWRQPRVGGGATRTAERSPRAKRRRAPERGSGGSPIARAPATFTLPSRIAPKSFLVEGDGL